MNLARGLKRLFVVASAVYWLVAIANAISVYSDVLGEARSYPDRFCAPKAEAARAAEAADAAAGMAPAADAAAAADAPLDFSSRAAPLSQNGTYQQYSRCLDNPNLARESALRAVGKALGLAALAYSIIAGALAALWWIVAGFRSPKDTPE
jgi:hypothetical protein